MLVIQRPKLRLFSGPSAKVTTIFFLSTIDAFVLHCETTAMNNFKWRVREDLPQDASALVGLPQQVYGDSYCAPRAFNPEY